MKAFSGKCSLQGSREEEEGKNAQLMEPKDAGQRAVLAGSVESLQTCYFPAQKQACKDHSCWVTLEFISQLIKEAGFFPSSPFLPSISGVVHRQTRPGLVLPALAWRVGRDWRAAKHTDTYSGQSWFSGAGKGAGGCPGRQGSSAGSRHTRFDYLSLWSGFPSPQTTGGGESQSHVMRLDNSSPSSALAPEPLILLNPTQNSTMSSSVSCTKQEELGNRQHSCNGRNWGLNPSLIPEIMLFRRFREGVQVVGQGWGLCWPPPCTLPLTSHLPATCGLGLSSLQPREGPVRLAERPGGFCSLKFPEP